MSLQVPEDDKIVFWDHLVSYRSKFSPELTVDCSQENVIRIFKLAGIPPEVEFSLFVKDDLHVEENRSKKKLPIRDGLINGFLNNLCGSKKEGIVLSVFHQNVSLPLNCQGEGLSSLPPLNLYDISLSAVRRSVYWP